MISENAEAKRHHVAKLIYPIASHFLSQKFWFLMSLSMVTLFEAALVVGTPYLLSRLIDDLAIAKPTNWLILGFLFYAGASGLMAGLQRALQYLAQSFESTINFKTSVMLMERVLHKTPSFFIDTNPAEVQSSIQQAQTSLRTIFDAVFTTLLPGFCQFLLTLLMISTQLNTGVAMVVLGYGVIVVGFSYLANSWTRPLLNRANDSFRENAKQLGNMVSAMETLRYFNGQTWAMGQFVRKAAEIQSAWSGWASRHVVYSAVFGLALAMQLAANFLIILPKFNASHLSIGDLVLFNTLVMLLNRPFEVVGTAIGQVVQSLSMLRPAAQIWQAQEETTLPITDWFSPSSVEALTFHRLSHSYLLGDYSLALNEISFEARRGQITFVVGESGAGKSTLLKIALKAIEPTNGRVCVDGVDLTSLDRKRWFQMIGVVPQEVVLLSGSILDNLTLGRRAEKAELDIALKRASIHKLIVELPEKIETLVGERGLKLSGGERQRIAIARAILKQPAILFLDEASSALDEGTERLIFEELRKLNHEMIIIAVTHRKSVVRPEDQVIFLKANESR